MKRTPKKWIDYTDWTVAQHAEHLRTETAYLDYYTQFDPKSIDKFIEGYAKTKHEWYKSEGRYKDEYESHQTRFMELADAYIDCILQKKLFNLQCQWRACLVELPLVDFIGDFEYWENHIRACPFLPIITEEEIDLCIRFLHEDLDDSNDPYFDQKWQDYDRFKNQEFVDDHEDDEDIELPDGFNCAYLPDLYMFFDTYQGTTGLMDLPNIRGEKEAVYKTKGLDIRYKERVAASRAAGTYKEPPPPELDEAGNVKPYVHIPSLYAFQPEKFIEAVEDERTKSLFKYYTYSRQGMYDLNYDGLEDDLDFLQEFDEPVPIEAYSDWRFAIKIAVYRFKQKKAAEMLPYAYDSYLLEFDDDEDLDTMIARRVANHQYDNKYQSYDELLENKKEFLDGREALTGKRDFNYLAD
jgi:hypothetical protein